MGHSWSKNEKLVVKSSQGKFLLILYIDRIMVLIIWDCYYKNIVVKSSYDNNIITIRKKSFHIPSLLL